MQANTLRYTALVLALFGTSPAFAAPNSLGVFGWAATNGGTTGGHGADKSRIYTVSTKAQLVKALYPDAVFNADGSWTSAAGLDHSKKIIYVKGRINLAHNAAGQEMKYEHFKDPAFDFNAYVAAYKPSVWTANPANWNATTRRPNLPSGPLEDARARSAARQASVINVSVGSNTSLLGLGSDARIINGQIQVQDVSNVVIRNITFEDAFDHFPEWTPTDSFVIDKTQPGCTDTFVDAATGPHKCPGGRWNTEYDLIRVHNSRNVWVDHCNFNDGPRGDWKYKSVFEAPHIGYDYLVQVHDGAVDVTGTSDFVTISNNKFEGHDKTNLLGSSNTATAANGWGALSITVANNWYENAGQRLPRVRFGKVHIYNNFFFGQIGYLGALAPTTNQFIPPNRYLYGIGIGNFAKIYAENNVFEIKDAPPAPTGTGAKVDDTVMYYNWYGANAAVGGVTQFTYMYDRGTILNGKARSITAAAQAQAITQGKPALVDTSTIWVPSSNYSYTLMPSSKVKEYAKSKVGVGKL